MKISDYANHVFLNCPFDDKYKKIFDAVLFTIFACGYIPKCALEIEDSSENRLKKILKLVNDCQFGIHDLSRICLDKNRLPRFNMPFELGLFVGAKYYGTKDQKKKNCLILESTPYQFQKFISDIAGNDVKAHNNKIEKSIALVRDWLNHQSKELIPGHDYIQKQYELFQSDTPLLCKHLKISPNRIPYKDYIRIVPIWLSEMG